MPSRGGARGKSGGGKRPPPSREETISKAMSYVLRHGAEKEGLKLNEGGYVNCGDLLAWPRLRSLKVTFPELQNIVATNSKQRFALIPSSESSISGAATAAAAGSTDASDYLIRATQGHSIKIDSANLLTPLVPDDENCPDEVVHGTFEDTWAKILKSGGLKKMGRQHVHFAMGVPTSSSSSRNPGTGKPDPKGSIVSKNKSASAEDEDDDDIAIDTFNITAGIPASIKTSNPAKPEETVISGMRASANILIWVDVKRSAVEGGLEWWRSANGVVLTEGDGEGKVGLEWVRRVERRGTGEVVWRGGEGGGRGKG